LESCIKETKHSEEESKFAHVYKRRENFREQYYHVMDIYYWVVNTRYREDKHRGDGL